MVSSGKVYILPLPFLKIVINMSKEQFPVDETITVLEGRTIYKSEKWWQAVILGEAFRRRFVAVYLWQRKGDRWRRVHKLKINSAADWSRLREVIDSLVKKMY